jgi:hypothetical protein
LNMRPALPANLKFAGPYICQHRCVNEKSSPTADVFLRAPGRQLLGRLNFGRFGWRPW